MRTISQFEARRYMEARGSLRERMTEIVWEMERRHRTDAGGAFSRWWDEEGAMRRYFDLKGKAEKIEQILAFSVIEQEEYPKMRGNDPSARRNYGASYPNDDQGVT